MAGEKVGWLVLNSVQRMVDKKVETLESGLVGMMVEKLEP